MDPNNIRNKYGFSFQFNNDICRRCRGTCCRGLAGYVWLNKEEMQGIAAMKKLSLADFSNRYVRQVNGKFSLCERVVNGEHFCCFFDPIDCCCTIYKKRPEQCRTFPFWNQFKDNPSRLQNECPGIVFNDPEERRAGE